MGGWQAWLGATLSLPPLSAFAATVVWPVGVLFFVIAQDLPSDVVAWRFARMLGRDQSEQPLRKPRNKRLRPGISRARQTGQWLAIDFGLRRSDECPAEVQQLTKVVHWRADPVLEFKR